MAVRAAARIGICILALLTAYVILRSTGFHQFTSGEYEGLNTLILLVGSIYAVILAFAIFVIWGQFTEVENCVMRECNSLRDLVRFSEIVGGEMGRSVRKAVAAYAQHVVRFEWEALGDGHVDKRAEQLHSDLIQTVIAGVPEDAAHARLIEMARRAGERRGERVAKSITRIPPTMFWFVNTIAGVLLLLVFVYPFHSTAVGAGCLGLVALVLLLANFVMTDMDNPLSGAWNVDPGCFTGYASW
jgi:hypothetical protein